VKQASVPPPPKVPVGEANPFKFAAGEPKKKTTSDPITLELTHDQKRSRRSSQSGLPVKWIIAVGSLVLVSALGVVFVVALSGSRRQFTRDEFQGLARGTPADVSRNLGWPSRETTRIEHVPVPTGGVFYRFEEAWERAQAGALGAGRTEPRLVIVWTYERSTHERGSKRVDAAATILFRDGVVSQVEFTP
jgi:hypothetical protein